MRFSRVCLEAIGYHLPEEEVSSLELEHQLAPLYERLNFAPGGLQSLTGIHSRRFWPVGTSMAEVATVAARRALDQSGVAVEDLGVVIYAGVCRDNLEPATACAVANNLGVAGDVEVYDLSNACLGTLSGLLDVACRIELGFIKAGLIVAAESARTIVESTVAKLNQSLSMPVYRLSVATLTGGSGAVALVLTHEAFSDTHRYVAGGVVKAAPRHHRDCRWGPPHGLLGDVANIMETDAQAVLASGVELGRATWHELQRELSWTQVDRVIGHQVGDRHRKAILNALGLTEEMDYNSYKYLGNMGTVSVPLTAALAEEAGMIQSGDRVALLGIGSGLNCAMIGVVW